MKKLLFLLLLCPGLALTQTPPPAPASVQDVIDGTATYKFISPKVAADVGLAPATNGMTLQQVTNIAQVISATNSTTGNAATATRATNIAGMPHLFMPVNYGAVGDGVTDDTVAMTNCLLAANATGRYATVDLGGLTYLVNASLVVTQRDFTLRNGKIITTNNTIKLVDVRNDRFRADYVFLGGPGTNWGVDTSFGFHFERSGTYIQRPILNFVKITNFWHGVRFVTSVEAKIEHSQITACGSNGVFATACDGLVIRQSVLGNSVPYVINLADPGIADANAQTNAMCFYIDGGQRQIIENCDMNASGSVGIVWNTTSGTPHFIFRENNCEEFWNPDRAYLTLSNVSYTIINSRFTPKTGPSVFAVKAINCIGFKSHIGPNLALVGGAGNMSGRVRSVGGTLPFIEGFWDNNQDNAIVVYSATEGGAQSTYGQTVVPNFALQTRFTQQMGDQFASMVVGGTPLSYGVTNNGQKHFKMAMPLYSDTNTLVGLMFADMASDSSHALWLGYNGNTSIRNVNIATSTDGSYGSPAMIYQFNSSGMAAGSAGRNITTTGYLLGTNHNYRWSTNTPTLSEQGAATRSDGTNLYVALRNGGGVSTERQVLAPGTGSQGQVVTWHGSGAIWSNPPAGGSVTITNYNAAAGLVTGGSGSYGIGTNVSAGTQTPWASDINAAQNNLTNALTIQGSNSAAYSAGRIAFALPTVSGDVFISGGTNIADADSQGGGDIVLRGGKGGIGSSTGGSIELIGGDTTGGTGGDIILTPGTPSGGDAGAIYLNGDVTATGTITATNANILGALAAGSFSTAQGDFAQANLTNAIWPNNTASRLAMFDSLKQLTNVSASSAATPINRDGTATTAAQIGGMFSGGLDYLKADGTTGIGGGSSSFNFIPQTTTNFPLSVANKKYQSGGWRPGGTTAATCGWGLFAAVSPSGTLSVASGGLNNSVRTKFLNSGTLAGINARDYFCATNRSWHFTATVAFTNGATANINKVGLYCGGEASGDANVRLGWRATTDNMIGTNWVAEYYNGSSFVQLYTNSINCDIMQELGLWSDGAKIVWTANGVNVATNSNSATAVSAYTVGPLILQKSTGSLGAVFLQSAELIYEIYATETSQE